MLTAAGIELDPVSGRADLDARLTITVGQSTDRAPFFDMFHGRFAKRSSPGM
jgi:hypothetical protein